MKNSTFSAQVANNLLTVLQGYSKTIRLLLVMCLTLTVSANAWGADVTFATSAYNGKGGASGTGGNATATIDGVTITSTKAYYTSAHIREYSEGTITVSSSSNITKIVFTSTASGTNSNGPGKISLNSGGGSYSYSGTAGTWTGSSTSIKFDCDAQFRWTKIVVTIASSHTVTWTINPAAGGTLSATSGNSTTVSPNAAYTYGAPAYTVTSGAATVSQSGNTFTATPTANSTIQINMVEKTKCTVTLNAGPGTCAASVTEASAGAGVTLPTPTLDGCDEWSFAGWKTNSAVTTETTTMPDLIPAGAYSPTSNITLYAVYQRTEGGGGGGEASLTKMVAGNTLSDGDKIVVVANETSTAMYQETINSSYVNKWDCSTLTADVVADDDKNWWTVTMTTGGFYLGDATNGYLNMSSNNLYCNANKSVWTLLDLEDGTFKLQSNGRNLSYRSDLNTNPYWRMGGASYGTSGQTILNLYKYTSGGGGSTTYYHSTPDCASTPTLTVNPTSLAFGNVATDSNKELDFTLTGSNLTANATLALSGADASKFSVSPTSATQSDGTIDDQTVTVTYTPAAAGEHTATLTISSTGAESKTVTLSGTGVAPAAKYTVTFNAGSGSCSTTSLQETSGGAGVTLPTANPSATCQSEGWTFAGWWTASVAGTTTSPGELLTADSNYKPASNCTLYAVYSHTEAGGGGGSSEITLLPSSFPDKGSNAYDSGAERTATVNGIDFGGHHITGNPTNTPSGATQNQYLQCRANDATIYNKTELPGKITQIVVNQYDAKAFSLYCGSTQLMASDNVDRTQTPSGTKITDVSAATTMTWDVDGNYTFFALKKGSNAGYVQSIIITYSGGGSTTTYNSNPVCVASWSITYNFEGGTGSHCSNTNVPQGDPYTICDEAPTKEGNTFLHWSDGVNTYNPSDVIATVTTDITLTAVWQPNIYTVIWSDNGATTSVPYEHGDTLELPSEPESCDGVKEFVGWTTHSGYYSATTAPDDIFTTKTATVTANATYYAVFATPGAGGTEFVLGTSGTFKMYANVNGTNYYAQGGVSSSKITATTNVSNASDYTLTYTDGSYTIKQGTNNVGNKTNDADLNTNETTWTISEGTNGSWRVTSNVSTSRALSYSTSASAFKAYATSNITAGDDTYFDIEFGAGSSGYTDYTTICEQVESIVVENPQTEFYVTDDFTIGTGTVTATLSGGGTADVTALAHFSGYNMNVVGTYTITVTYMGATATYEINVKALDNAWVLTWNVSGKTNTGLGPRSVTKGSAIGTLPVPEVPAACEGKTFMGWTESNIVPSDGVGIVYITEATVPTKNTTYYAVFANINNFCTQAAIEDIESGSKVVIVAVASMDASGGAGKAISSRATDDTHNLQGDDVAIYDQTINTPHSTCIWTITQSGEKYIFTQDGKYLNGIIDGSYSNLKYNNTSDSWSLSNAASGMAMTYNMKSTNASTEYVEWYNGKFTIHDEVNTNGAFDMQFYVTLGDDADITDYTTGCEEFTITYYGFRGGYSTSCSSDGVIVLPVNSEHVVPNCGDVVKDHTDLGREFLNVWMTEPHGGHTFKPGDTLILTQDTILYAQWKLETEKETTTLPTDIEDLAGTDVYVYGGTTLSFQPGTTTINTLVLKGGIQKDGSYQMPKVWVPAGATLKRNSNKIYLDLAVNAKTWYPFAVPFAAKNNQYVEYIDPTLAAASTYGTHFAIKTYDGARRATEGEDRPENWVRVLRDATLQPGVGYIISAMTYPDKDTATIRIPMTVPNTWFDNGEQAVVGTTTRNAVTVTGHTGAAATEHQRHAGWNFVASPFLSNFAGSSIGGEQGYINGWIDISDDFNYKDTEVRYVTIPAYDFAYYSQQKMSEVTLSPEWSFFVQIAADQGGTMSFATSGRQQAPAALRANSANANPSFEANIVIINEQEQTADHTGLVINDRYTPAYEIGGDLEKMFGSAYRTNIYTLSQNTRLAYNALSYNDATLPIPLGFRAAEAGEYTIQLTNPEEIVGVESIMLKDNYNNQTTNLLLSDYTFYTDKTQDDNRLVIYIVPVKNTPTDVTNIEDKTETRKVIFNHHLYIIHNGNIYNGVGQKM